MPEYVKALIVVLGIAAAVYALAAPQLAGIATSRRDYWRRATVWFVVTAAAFLAHSYWVFAIIGGALLLFNGRADHHPLAFYCALLFAVPPLGSNISGLGLVNYLFDLNYLRLLSLAVLLPAALRLLATRRQRLPPPKLPDLLLGSYLLLLFILTLMAVPFTTALRQGFYLFIDIWLVYYVASRSVRSLEAFREVVAAFVLGATIMAVIAIFEAGRDWLLYSTLESTLDVVWGYGEYMGRGAGGPLRAMASTGHPIVMGYLMVVAIPLLMYLRPSIRSAFIWWLALATLVGALIATLSRGPWLGGVAMAIVVTAIGRGAAKRFALLGAGVAAASIVALFSEWGRGLVDYLPFIGNVSSETVDYRQRLLEVSLRILSQSPLFGEPRFYGVAAAQELRQGEGIIDVVNSYLGIAIGSGIVGLSLFVAFFASAIVLVWRSRLAGGRPLTETPARALLAALAGILVTIATTSSINIIPPVYLVIAGMAVGCRVLRAAEQHADLTRQPAAALGHARTLAWRPPVRAGAR
jgi:O-antigen ligase